MLGAEVLQEIPTQLVKYFESKGIKANPPKKHNNPVVKIIKNKNAEEQVEDPYYIKEKAKILAECIKKSINYVEATAYLDNVGIPTMDTFWISANKDNKDYHNPLKI